MITGMLNRYYNPEEISPERLQKLAGFQIKVLRNALTKYPDAKRVVYSTCSLLPEENEDVVRQVLETNYNFKLVPAKQSVSGAWKNFGSPDYGELGAYCLYARPDEDFTTGFFVAVFERLNVGEENKFFNNKIYSYKRNRDKKERKQVRKLERQLRQKEENVAADGSNTITIEETKPLVLEEYVETKRNLIDEEKNCERFNDTSRKQKKKKAHLGKNTKIFSDNLETIQNVSYVQLNNKSLDNNNCGEDLQENVEHIYKKSKKKKRKVIKEIELNNLEQVDSVIKDVPEELPGRKKRKHKKPDVFYMGDDIVKEKEENRSYLKNKKPKNITSVFNENYVTTESSKTVNPEQVQYEENALKNKKKRRLQNVSSLEETDKSIEIIHSIDVSSTKKKKKKHKIIEDDTTYGYSNIIKK